MLFDVVTVPRRAETEQLLLTADRKCPVACAEQLPRPPGPWEMSRPRRHAPAAVAGLAHKHLRALPAPARLAAGAIAGGRARLRTHCPADQPRVDTSHKRMRRQRIMFSSRSRTHGTADVLPGRSMIFACIFICSCADRPRMRALQ